MNFHQAMKHFDVTSFLEDYEIPYQVQGKNISKDWLGLTCPFCNDASSHFGIDLHSKACHCWRCGGHRLTDFLQAIASLTYGEALDIIRDYVLEEPFCEKTASRVLSHPKFSLPSYFTPLYQNGFTGHSRKPVDQFLRDRGLPPKETCQKWSFYWGGSLGPYKFRIVIPIFLFGELVSFTTRDVTGHADPKYKTLSKEKSLLPVKSTLYNLDSVKKGGRIVICEGPFDVIKLGAGVCTYGTSWSQNQVDLLKEKRPKKVFILFDNEPEAQKNANRLADALWFTNVDVLCLKDYKDPGELPLKEAQELMKSLV